MSKRIGIDARFYNESGIGRYIRNLIYELQRIDEENDYYVFLLKPQYDSLVYHTKNFHKVLADFKWYGITEQIKFPRLLKKYDLDLVHFPHFNVPIFYRGKFTVTIHDLIHEKFEMRRATTHDPLMYKLKHLGYRKVFSSALKKSEKIITVSNYVKKELIKNWTVNEDKIVVTYEAVDDKMFAIANKMSTIQVEKVLGKFKIKRPFIFYVGNAHPHKNVEGLIKAFSELKPSRLQGKDTEGLQLVLSGQDHYFWERIRKEFQTGHPEFISGSKIPKQVRNDIVFTGYISDQELVALYKSAKVFVMPSFEEGFGIPILEAMACGTPVVSSNIGALKEVGGEAVLYFDPYNIKEMAEKIIQVLNSPTRHPDPAQAGEGSQDLRSQLIEKGNKRVKQFSWEKLAKETLKTYLA